jgi:hypothetical protein
MSFFEREAKVEILPISGMLRVTIQPQPNFVLMMAEVAIAVLFWTTTVRTWSSLSLLERGFFIWGDISTVVAFLYQISGSEQIEFEPQKLTIRKSTVGWGRTREYLVDECTELQWCHAARGNQGSCLHCKVGWKMVRFAGYISEKQATEIFRALEQNLPDVFCRMATTAVDKPHFQTLGLS